MMNKHTKIAIIVAPLLMILGYAASDLFLEHKASEAKVIALVPSKDCHVLQDGCILSSDDFKINVFDKAGMTTINATFPLDKAVLFLVDKDNNASAFPLTNVGSKYYWQSATPLRELSAQFSDYKLRVVASIKGGEYISEFVTQL